MKKIKLVWLFLIIFSSVLYSGVNLNDGLVAHYEFEGNAKDSSGNGNDGVAHGGVGYSDGLIGQAGSFDGLDDYIDINSVPDLGEENYSVSLWFKGNHKTLGTLISLEKHRYFWINLSEGKVLSRFEAYPSNSLDFNIYTTKEYTDLQWHNIVSIKTDNTLKLYVDGTYIGQPKLKGKTRILSSYSRIANYNSGSFNEQFYNGLIDDVRVYNKALDEIEIAELYKMGNGSTSNQAPTADAGEDKSVLVNNSITLIGIGTDSDGTIKSYQWTEGNKIIASSASFSYKPTTYGKHILTLITTDNNGANEKDSVTINAYASMVGSSYIFDKKDGLFLSFAESGHNIVKKENVPIHANGSYQGADVNSWTKKAISTINYKIGTKIEVHANKMFWGADRCPMTIEFLDSSSSVIGSIQFNPTNYSGNSIYFYKNGEVVHTQNENNQSIKYAQYNGKIYGIFKFYNDKIKFDSYHSPRSLGTSFEVNYNLKDVKYIRSTTQSLSTYPTGTAISYTKLLSVDSTTAKKTINGTVKDNNGNALSGINVKFEYLVDGKEKSATATSNGSGSYSIKLDKSAFSNKGVNYLMYAYRKGYHPATKNIKIDAKDSYRVDFVINRIKVYELVLEIEPKVHHLGDDSYGGSNNSQFQKKTEGKSFSKSFKVSSNQYHNYKKSELKFKAKGIQASGSYLIINNKSYKLSSSPSNGSYAVYTIDIKKRYYKQGINSLKITSGKRGSDYDDFEFSNIVLEFSGIESEKDSDDDGISDKDEIRLGLNPNSKDSDGDGILDGDEIGDINNPKDSDGDGVIDALDNDEACTEEEDSNGEIKDCDKDGGTEEEKYVKYDFNGDGLADILWKKGDGYSLWYMSENGKHKYKYIGKKRGYTIAGIADFNGDKISDILWKKGSGNYLWYMKADGKHKYKNIGKKTGYKVAGVADFNGDGIADILWKKGGGHYLWYMKINGKHGYKNIGKKFGYSVAGVADFNGDNIADILWKKGGGNYLWYMRVNGKHKYKNIGRKTGYTIAGVSDFNEDGIADIFWKRGSGNYLWYMKVDGKHKYKNMGRKKGYSVKMVADFDGDGVTDVLWKKGSGNYLWYMETNGKHRYKNIGRKATSYFIQF